mmetsp:Transcript_9446/g.14608  ORF Transcript_9446/g.14608 Transcript_9446/m.14608 type:complete len:80 (+) Transcript_9446:1620-1859(+)
MLWCLPRSQCVLIWYQHYQGSWEPDKIMGSLHVLLLLSKETTERSGKFLFTMLDNALEIKGGCLTRYTKTSSQFHLIGN